MDQRLIGNSVNKKAQEKKGFQHPVNTLIICSRNEHFSTELKQLFEFGHPLLSIEAHPYISFFTSSIK